MSDIRYRDFQCQEGFIKGYKYHLPYTTCVFCKHCAGIFWDFSSGIYGLICGKDVDIAQIKANIIGECKHFIEETEEIV